ncbi:MAG TPA: GNAT family N-acetyltransferase [Micromonosporaceae bacterium]|nr:GNAT family N-acetyltransferase [Micromonosporaceae bacterium]
MEPAGAALPAGWRVRRPTLDDVPAILAVVHAGDIAAVGYPDFTADDVREVLTAPATDPERDCWVALDPALRPTDEADMRRFHYILDTAFADTPDHAPSTYEMWRERVDALPVVDWDEWFVAEVDGFAVGVLQPAYQPPEEDEGWVKNLAVLREHRKRGVGAALLARAFAVYAGKGRRYAGLGVDLANPTHARRLYGAVGMTASYEVDIYERPVTH